MLNLLTAINASTSLAIVGLSFWELAIVGIVVLVLFGNRLPTAAKSLGQSFSAFKKGIKEGAEEDDSTDVGSGRTEKIEHKV
ncbi:MAG: twin-arginine translocase TatA/TatE family subunit [Planctomycetaceae bacterium]|nr:twin-arginine translocase TatA/TatE family subunit [Planctomycetaceae bacterium]